MRTRRTSFRDIEDLVCWFKGFSPRPVIGLLQQNYLRYLARSIVSSSLAIGTFVGHSQFPFTPNIAQLSYWYVLSSFFKNIRSNLIQSPFLIHGRPLTGIITVVKFFPVTLLFQGTQEVFRTNRDPGQLMAKCGFVSSFWYLLHTLHLSWTATVGNRIWECFHAPRVSPFPGLGLNTYTGISCREEDASISLPQIWKLSSSSTSRRFLRSVRYLLTRKRGRHERGFAFDPSTTWERRKESLKDSSQSSPS